MNIHLLFGQPEQARRRTSAAPTPRTSRLPLWRAPSSMRSPRTSFTIVRARTGSPQAKQTFSATPRIALHASQSLGRG